MEAALRDAARADDDFLTEVASHLIPAGGKRLRPAFVIAAALTERDAPTRKEMPALEVVRDAMAGASSAARLADLKGPAVNDDDEAHANSAKRP